MDVPDDETLICKTAGPDATYLEAVHMQWSFMTSIEAMELWDRAWMDEQTNVELVSGCGPFIPTVFEPESRLHLERNPDFLDVARWPATAIPRLNDLGDLK